MSGQDEDEDAMVPGFSYRGAGGSWWGKDEEGSGDGYAGGAGVGGPLPEGGRKGGAGHIDNTVVDDFIPGFGAADNLTTGRQNGPLPSQEDMYVTGPDDWNHGGNGNGGGVGGGGDDWARSVNPSGGGSSSGPGNRQGRWGPRRGGGGGRY